jgi:hypothetical protein
MVDNYYHKFKSKQLFLLSPEVNNKGREMNSRLIKEQLNAVGVWRMRFAGSMLKPTMSQNKSENT